MIPKPNATDHDYPVGTWVEYGTSGPHGGDRLGVIVMEQRQYGQDGYLIQPLSGGADEGTLPSVYPGRMIHGEWQPHRWERRGGHHGWGRTYAEIGPGGVHLGPVDDGSEQLRLVPVAEAVAGLFAYARSLGPGTPACGVWEQRALAMARRFGVTLKGSSGGDR